MADMKILKGQAWISGDSLVQDQTLVMAGKMAENTVSIIEDIWEDLLSEAGTYKTNGRGYFYWEYKMTSLDDDSVEVVCRFECPRPKEGLFDEPYDPDDVKGDYAKYWVEKFKNATENFEDKAAIQKKEVIFPGTSYVDQHGDVIDVPETKVKNNDLGDIQNLLGLF